MTVFFRTTGTMAGPEFFLKRKGGGLGAVRMPVTVAVIERPDGLVLIDTGWSRRSCAFPEDDPGRITSAYLGLQVKPEDALASQIISCGFSPDDVKHIIATHLHLDHVGGAVDFAKATFHASSAEWDAMGRGRLGGYDPRTQDLASRSKLHDLNGPAAMGFSASHDLFDDGTVLLLDARGHTRGSIAVAVKLETGWMLHAGDAMMFVDDFRDSPELPMSLYARVISQDVKQQRKTYACFEEAARIEGLRVIPSHDMAVFEALPKTREEGWKAAWEKKAPKPQQPPKPRAERPADAPRDGKKRDKKKPQEHKGDNGGGS